MMRLAAVWAVALALAARILIAPGTMPVADAGGVRIILCTGSGPVEALLDPGDRHGEPAKMAQDACPFAVLGLGALGSEIRIAPPAPPPVVTAVALPPSPARAPPGTSLPPATGPPSLG